MSIATPKQLQDACAIHRKMQDNERRIRDANARIAACKADLAILKKRWNHLDPSLREAVERQLPLPLSEVLFTDEEKNKLAPAGRSKPRGTLYD